MIYGSRVSRNDLARKVCTWIQFCAADEAWSHARIVYVLLSSLLIYDASWLRVSSEREK